MKMELTYIVVAVVLALAYFFAQYKLVFETTHPRSKKLILGMRINLALIAVLSVFCVLTFFVLYGQVSGIAIDFGKEFFLKLLNSDYLDPRRLLWLNMGVLIFEISPFIVALRISVKKRDYKNLSLERTLNSELVASFSCFAFSAIELLVAFLVYIF